MTNASLEKLAEFAERNELPWDATCEERFATYLELLHRFNGKMNLIGPMEPGEVVESLFADSLVAGVVTEMSGDVLDVGSGAGFPGIPLAIVFREARYTLIEPRRKRSQFLEIARRRLDLEHVEVVRARIEEMEEALFDVVCSKAFQPPPEWIETAAQWCKPGGVVVTLHAASAATELAAAAAALGLEHERTIEDVTHLGVAATNVVRAATCHRKPD